MRSILRPLALALPIVGLVLLWLGSRSPHAGSGAVSQETPVATVADPPSPAADISPPPVPAPVTAPQGALWSYSGETAGDPAGLSPLRVAASFRQAELPEGTRWRVDHFPNPRWLREGEAVTVSLPDGRVFPGVVNYSQRDEGYENLHQVAIGFTGEKGGVVAAYDAVTSRISGRVMVEGDERLWTLRQQDDGSLWLVEHLREHILCERPRVEAAARSNPLPSDSSASATGTTPPVLNSRPGASAVLYLDFDGAATTTYPDWPASNPGGNRFSVPHSGLTAAQMTTVWRRVAEDFIQFNINVTTQSSKYSAASVGSRMRILIGKTLPDHVDGAGLAIIGSFRTNAVTGLALSSNVPCWLEVDAYGDPATATDAQLSSLASNTTHEFGHTLTLQHDGAAGDADGYYDGHGTAPNDWSPIMGSAYRSGWIARGIVQWAKDDYPGANNPQDDLFIISGTINGFGYAPDESDGWVTASATTSLGGRRLGGEGIISNKDDLDWWHFQVPYAGAVTVEVAPADGAVSLPNLDCGFRIEDQSGNTVAGGFGTENNLEVKQTVNLPAGTYYVVAYGTGNKTWTSGGYDDYGSTGRYLVTIDLPPDNVAPIVVIQSPVAGVLTSPTLTFNGTASDNESLTSLTIFLRRQSDGSYWNGSFWTPIGVPLAGSYNAAAGTWACTSTLPQPGGSGPGSLNAGSYDFIAKAEDAAGNKKDATVTVTVDSAGPAVAISTPRVVLGATNYAFNGTSQDSAGVQAVNCFIRRDSDGLYWNGTGWGAPPINLPTNHVAHGTGDQRPWACTSPNLPQPGAQLTQGTYTFIAIATDTAGNHTQTDSVVLIDDNQPPQITVTTPAHNGFAGSTLQIGGTATDMSGIRDGQVTFTLYQVSTGRFWNGSAWQSDLFALHGPVSGGTWSYAGGPSGASLNAGQYLISASAFDQGGTLSQPQNGVNQTSFRVDLDPPTVAIANPVDGTTVTALPGVSGTAGDSNGLSAVRLYLYRYSDGQFWDGSAWGGGGSAILPTQISGGTWSSVGALPQPGSNSSVNLTNGSYNLIAFALDTAGNQTRADAVFSVELTFTWTGATLRDAIPNNNTTSWDEPLNWSPIGVPGAEDKIVIANGDTVDSAMSRTVRGLDLAGGALNIVGTLTTTHGSAWTDGTFIGRWENQGTLTTSGPARKLLWDDAVLDNFGTVVWNGAGTLQARSYTSGPSFVNNKPGAVFRIGAGGGSVFSREYGGPRASFRNEAGARLEFDGEGAGVATLSVWEFVNHGELRVNNGTLAFVDGAQDGYDLYLHPGTTLTGNGVLRLTNATQLMTAVHAQCTVEQVGDSWLGCLDAAGTDQFEGTYNWKGGVIQGELTLGPAGVLNIMDPAPDAPTAKQLWDSTTLNNDGTVNWLGAGPLRARGYTAGPSIFNNRAGGTFNISAEGTVVAREYGGPRAVFNNLTGATLRKHGAGTATLTIWEWHNSGEINVAGGSLVFADGARDGYDLFLEPGTTLTGAGTLRLNNATQLKTAVNAQCPVVLVPDSWLGCLDPAGTDVIEGNWTWQGGVVQGNLTVGALGTLTLNEPTPSSSVVKQLWDDTVLDNLGTVVWQGGGPLQTRSYTSGPATVNNRSGAVFRVEADGSVLGREYGGPTGTFVNHAGGKFLRSAGDGAALLHSLNFVNQGEIEVATGVLSFNTALTLAGTGSLEGAGRFEMSGGRVSVPGVTTLAGTTFSVLAGDIVGETGSWLTTGGAAWRWLGGIFSGQMEIGTGSRLEISDPPAATNVKLLWDDAILVNRGTIAWSGTGSLRGRGYTSGPAFIRQKSGALFSVETDSAVMDREYGGPVVVLVNEQGATISKNTGNGAVPVVCDWRLENAGSVVVNGGGLDFQRGGDSSGTFAANATGVVRFTGGSHVLRHNTALGGTGAVRIQGGEMVGDGTIALSFPPGAAFELLAGSVVGVTHYTGNAVFNWKGGVIAGELSLGSGLDTRVSGPDFKELWDSTTVTNQGLITWLGESPIVARGYTAGPSVIVNASGATFRLAGTGAAFGREYGGPRPVFQNQAGGLFERAAMAGETTVSIWEIHNAGQIKVGAGGRLSFVDGPYDGYDVFLEPGTALTGTGELRLQTATSLTADVTATCTVDLPDPSWFAGLEAAGNARFTGPLRWTGGVMAGTLTFGAGSAVVVQDATAGANVPKQLWDDTVIHNHGTWTWAGGGTLRARSYTGGPSRFHNRAGGTLSLAAAGTFANREYGGPVPVLENAGTIVTAGVRGARSMNGWTYTQTGTGTLSVTLAGTATGSFDSFGTDSGGTMAGTLAASLAGGFTPAVGNAFRVVTLGSGGGTFASVSTPGAFFTRSYDANGFTLTATDAPVDLADWKSYFFGNDAVAGGDLADPDGDGLVNLIEYALSLNPKNGATGGLPGPQRTADSKLSLTFSRRLNNDVAYQVEGSDDQKTWTMLALLPAGATQWTGPGAVSEVAAGSTCTCTVIDTAVIGVRKLRFLRLRVSKP